MLVDYHNIITTKRNLMISLILLFITTVAEQNNINMVNLYFLTLDLSKIQILDSLDKILLFLSCYFFIVYYSFLINDNNIIRELNDSFSFKLLYKIIKSTHNVTFKKYMFFIFYPFIFIFDSLISKNFAIYFSPMIFFYITIYIYFYKILKNINEYISLFIILLLMIFFYELWKLLLMKNNKKFQKIDNKFFNKYSESKKLYLNRKKIDIM
ncbi:hypothetical protein AN286_09985 [Aliarcobacter cryaerophilus ATCC 43158]|uniref:Membrane protein n=2 Tax=Aliarcobacter cryaerophilus TaxID=28198 RepID=A0AAD0TU18_9BACT|nr:putative membrane protein [Aliarcobacter cryaerophilus ATCC 43158]QCZ24710.1 hypothetical protein AN286_09985 [Aliarcobacter cryaerophilus ATCC 43158]